MSGLVRRLDALHGTVVSYRALNWYTWLVRVLLALGFLPAGLLKVLVDKPFSNGDPRDSDMDLFFYGLYKAGYLYEFIGWAQILASVLLLIPITATLGAMMYLPLIAGIEVITTTMNFRGTIVITTLMLLGNVYLLCWAWPHWRGILGITQPYDPRPASTETARVTGGESDGSATHAGV